MTGSMQQRSRAATSDPIGLSGSPRVVQKHNNFFEVAPGLRL